MVEDARGHLQRLGAPRTEDLRRGPGEVDRRTDIPHKTLLPHFQQEIGIEEKVPLEVKQTEVQPILP